MTIKHKIGDLVFTNGEFYPGAGTLCRVVVPKKGYNDAGSLCFAEDVDGDAVFVGSHGSFWSLEETQQHCPEWIKRTTVQIGEDLNDDCCLGVTTPFCPECGSKAC